VNWQALAAEKRARYELQHGEEDERSIVRRGNVAYAAGLALLMAHDDTAGTWFLRAAERWQASWDVGAGRDSWGRPVGAIKAESPIGRYAATLALLVLARWADARHQAELLQGHADFPPDVAAALAFVAGNDPVAFVEAAEAVVRSFETRSDYLEDVPVADTALVLERLATRRGFRWALPASPTVPASSD
jgi:hypothetical protein